MAINVNGYHSEGNWESKANGKYAFVEKGGKVYFIKMLDYCKWSSPEAAAKYPALKAENEKADKMKAHMELVNNELCRIAGAGGDLVVALDFFVEDGVLYKVNAFIDQENIDEKHVHETLTPEEIDECMVSVLQAVYAMHKRNIIHGDLKPANIILTRKGKYIKALVSDFDDSFFIGDVPKAVDLIADNLWYSPELQYYISNIDDPEAPVAKAINGRSDIFTLGLVWHMYLTGTMPGLPRNCRTAAQAVLEGKPLRLSDRLDDRHREIIGKMLEPRPMDRYANCNEIIAALRMSKPSRGTDRITESKVDIRVVNGEGKPMKKQEVTVGNTATRKYVTCRTDDKGCFSMKLEPGLYVIAAEKADYPFRKEIMEVVNGADKKVTFTMYKKIKATEHTFDPPVKGRYTSLLAIDDQTYELTTVTGRKMTVYKDMLKLYGIDIHSLEL